MTRSGTGASGSARSFGDVVLLGAVGGVLSPAANEVSIYQ
jgi:hypothetical protein